MRDLSRARENALGARLKARQQLKALLLRHGHRYTGRTFWTAAHEWSLASISFAHPARYVVFVEYRHAVREAQDRLDRLTQALRDDCEHWRIERDYQELKQELGLGHYTRGATGAAFTITPP